MDFPFFHLSFFGDRLLIGVIAALHVIINHAFAVGAIPLIVWFEWRGRKTGDVRNDVFAKRLMKICFITTTTVGALTGVGIWFAIGLVNPEAIGSLLRIFFWAWFTEWLVFISEVVLILAYYLTWDSWTGERKARHIKLGMLLAVMSWVTMAIIVAILGFMMIPGGWLEDRRLITALLNAAYLPQLAFRTGLAMILAGALGLAVSGWCAAGDREFRRVAIRLLSLWILAWLPFTALAAMWYAHAVPAAMWDNVGVALGTQAFAEHQGRIVALLAGLLAAVALTAVWGALKPARIPWPALLVPALVGVLVMGVFERTREFIRKPYVIGGYMYANRFRVEDYPLLQHDGILKYSTYASVTGITPENRTRAGGEIFQMTCATCHTVDGVNGIVGKLDHLFPGTRWEPDNVRAYLDALHGARPFMPPFPGNAAELDALAAYLVSLQPPPPALGPVSAAEPSLRPATP